MKREILLLFSVAALALAGCATYEGNQGSTSAETGVIYSAAQSTSDFGRGEVWRNTPNAQRERGLMKGPVGPTWEELPAGDYRP